MKYSFFNKMFFAAIATMFLMAACSSNPDSVDNTKPDVNVTKPPVVPPTPIPDTNSSTVKSDITTLRYFGDPIVVTTRNDSFTIQVRAFDSFNAPVETGRIKVFYPQENTEFDIGTIAPQSAKDIEKGIATFQYKAPQNVALAQSKAKNSQVTFLFSDESNGSRYIDIPVVFKPSTAKVPDLEKYAIDLVLDDQKGLDLDAATPFNIVVKESKSGAIIDSKRIKSIKIESLRTNYAQLILGTDGTKSEKDSLTFGAGKNNVSSFVSTKKISGLAMFKITAVFTDALGNTLTDVETKSVTVFSGPPTATSIYKLGSEHDLEKGQFIDHLALQVTDKYNNPVTPLRYPSQFNVNSVAGPAHDAKYPSTGIIGDPADQNLWPRRDGNGSSYGRGDFGLLYDLVGGGKISSDGTKITFTDTSGEHDFSDVNINDDHLIIFGRNDVHKEFSFGAFGTWEIASATATTLTLVGDAAAFKKLGTLAPGSFDNLHFVVGHNFRSKKTCENNEVSTLRTEPKDGITKLNVNGVGYIDVSYDYPLVGADVFVGANIVGMDNKTDELIRIGAGYKRFLSGVGIKETAELKFTAYPGRYYVRNAIGVDILETGYVMYYGYAGVVSVGDGYAYTFNKNAYNDTNTSDYAGIAATVYEPSGLTDCNNALDLMVNIVTDDPTKPGTVTITVPSRFGSELR